MADIRPFAAIHFARKPGVNFSDLIAPPYDVLDEGRKNELEKKHPNNIVTIDLPHLPAKTVGPDEAYDRSGMTLESWLNDGVLVQDTRPATYPYTQTYEHNGRTYHRRGFFALVRLSPFGAGHVVPHEQTYAAAIEDRLKLMRATAVQLSPIFGVFPDPRNEATNLLYKNLGRPEFSATLDGVRNDLWSVIDAEVENTVADKIGGKPIYIADGHHRYTTALQYQFEMERRHGGQLPENHPANWCLFNLVSMDDPGLLIFPTHRLLGGLSGFDINRFKRHVAPFFNLVEPQTTAADVAEYARDVLPRLPAHTFGLFDGKTRKLYEMHLKDPDVLAEIAPDKSDAWRRLDVAICQHFLIEKVIQPLFAAGKEVKRSYTADPDEIAAMTDGQRSQIALLLQSTPIHSLVELGAAGEVMPPKSTYFYPKLATGMVMASLR